MHTKNDMKIVYLIHSTYNPGGMERVLLNKVSYLVEKMGWEVTVVTTDQKDRPPFYPFPEDVRMIDLGINYSDDNGKPFLKKLAGYFKRRQEHKKRLKALLEQERPDVVDCFYPGECSFVPSLKDGSKKVMELHQSKLFHYQYNRSGLMGLADKVRARMDERLVRKFDLFVVLTQEDKQMWGEMPGIRVIPNAANFIAENYSDCSAKRVIAVGRLDYQKSFDRLIMAWEKVLQKRPDWRLDIFGQGEWQEMLQKMIVHRGLHDVVRVNAPTKNIGKEYSESSMIVMSSHYEGFPMVLVEAYNRQRSTGIQSGYQIPQVLYAGDNVWVEPGGNKYDVGCYETIHHEWVIHNYGKAIWTGRSLVLANQAEIRPKFSLTKLDIPDVMPGGIIKIAVDISANGFEGSFNCKWEMQDSEGKNCFPNSRYVFDVVVNVSFDYDRFKSIGGRDRG